MAFRMFRLPLVLPENPGERSRCLDCIAANFTSRRGVRRARVIPAGTNGQPHEAQIELDYDPDQLTLAQVNRYLAQAGGCVECSIAHLVLPVRGMMSPRMEQTVHAVLNRLPGVHASASYVSQTVRLEFDRRTCPLPEIARRLESVGVSIERGREASPSEAVAPPHVHAELDADAPPATAPGRAQPRGLLHTALRQPDLITAIIGAGFLLAGFIVHGAAGPQWLRIALLAVAYALCGWHTALDVFHVLRQFRFDIDVLMFAAAIGAASLGHYEEGALLLLLFALGGAGERLAIGRAHSAIAALSTLMPETATLVEPDGTQREVSVKDLAPGDRVLVPPGQRIPADGQVHSGNSAIDQAPITGESVPVDKGPGDDVFAGTINGQAVLTVAVTKPASETTLSKVIRMVEEAQTMRSPTQVFTDRVEKYYVPLVLVATAALIVLPPLVGVVPARQGGSLWQGWFYQAMAFLTAASPCALAIGTPAAVLSGIARSARAGVLIKGGAHLENLGRVRVVAFDKTGTLTVGQPTVTDVLPMVERLSAQDVLALAAALESNSRHPLAEAIVQESRAQQCRILDAQQVEQVEQVTGAGIRGVLDGRPLCIGKLSMLTPGAQIDHVRSEVERLESQGKTTVVMTHGQEVLGVIAMADQPRPGAAEMVRALHGIGVRKTIMLTGDNPRTAAAVAQAVGIDEYHAGLLPQDKLKLVRELDEQHGRVAMVGDGVNDAPALANASVGIAIGGASGSATGSDVALETADVVLLSDRLTKLPQAIGLSRFARRIVVQNLLIALGVIVVLAPLAALGKTPISAAVLFHEGSTVVVVLNALRILAWRGR